MAKLAERVEILTNTATNCDVGIKESISEVPIIAIIIIAVLGELILARDTAHCTRGQAP